MEITHVRVGDSFRISDIRYVKQGLFEMTSCLRYNPLYL